MNPQQKMNNTMKKNLLLLLPLTVALGCAPKKLNGPIGSIGTIPFDLVIPFTLGEADYYVIAGTKGEQQESQVADSIIEVPIWRTYAQFYPGDGVPADFEVWVNNTELQPKVEGSDTLRLRGSGDTSIVDGDQVWHFRAPDASDDLATFVLPPVGLLDTIGPLQSFGGRSGTIRSDTAFTIRWQPGKGGAIRIEWLTDDGEYVARDAQDFSGSYTFAAPVVAAVRGAGTIRVTRYRSITSEFAGKTVLALRLSQRSYRVSVQ